MPSIVNVKSGYALSLDDLIQTALDNEGRIVACTMSMDDLKTDEMSYKILEKSSGADSANI